MSGPLPQLGRRERALLLACARVQLDEQQASTAAELLRERLDWDAILFYARLHSVASLLHRHAKQLGDPQLIPATARRGLLALAQRTAYRNRAFAAENGRLVDAFQAAQVPVVIQKGLPVVELVYGGLALRPLIDLLFLVRPRELPAAGRVLLGQGYAAKPLRPLRALHRWYSPQRWYVRDDGFKLPVLVQGDLVDWPRRHRFTADRLLADSRPASLDGREVSILSPVDLVLYLCLAADKHGVYNAGAVDATGPVELVFGPWSNNRLIRFTDIHEVVRHHRHEIDWDSLVARAQSCGIEDAARASLALTERLLGATAPAAAVEALSGAPRPRLRSALLAMAGEPAGRPSPPRLLGTAWGRLGLRRQLELVRLVGLLELAFPGLEALRTEHGPRPTGKLVALSAVQAASILLRSLWAYLDASRRWSLR